MAVEQDEQAHQLEYRITNLRYDKIIYGVEACALNILCLLIFFFSTSYFSGALRTAVNVLALLAAVFYSLFMGIGNTVRLLEIRRLEERL